MKRQDLYAITFFIIFMITIGLAGASDIAPYVI